jgi:hypothetical protein
MVCHQDVAAAANAAGYSLADSACADDNGNIVNLDTPSEDRECIAELIHAQHGLDSAAFIQVGPTNIDRIDARRSHSSARKPTSAMGPGCVKTPDFH